MIGSSKAKQLKSNTSTRPRQLNPQRRSLSSAAKSPSLQNSRNLKEREPAPSANRKTASKEAVPNASRFPQASLDRSVEVRPSTKPTSRTQLRSASTKPQGLQEQWHDSFSAAKSIGSLKTQNHTPSPYRKAASREPAARASRIAASREPAARASRIAASKEAAPRASRIAASKEAAPRASRIAASKEAAPRASRRPQSSPVRSTEPRAADIRIKTAVLSINKAAVSSEAPVNTTASNNNIETPASEGPFGTSERPFGTSEGPFGTSEGPFGTSSRIHCQPSRSSSQAEQRLKHQQLSEIQSISISETLPCSEKQEDEHKAEILQIDVDLTASDDSPKPVGSPTTTESPTTTLPSDNYDPSNFRELARVLGSSNSPKSTLIIWDWDDTILPTYHLSAEHRLKITDTCIPDAMKQPLAVLESKVLKCLEVSLRSGCTVLVTNAHLTWIDYSARKYLNTVWTFLQEHQVPVVSARDLGEKIGLPQALWKKAVIRDIVESFFKSQSLHVEADSVADVLEKLQTIDVDAQFVDDFFGEAESRNPHSVQFYLDQSVPEQFRLDSFARRLSQFYNVDANILAMTGVLLESSHQGEIEEIALKRKEMTGDPKTERRIRERCIAEGVIPSSSPPAQTEGSRRDRHQDASCQPIQVGGQQPYCSPTATSVTSDTIAAIQNNYPHFGMPRHNEGNGSAATAEFLTRNKNLPLPITSFNGAKATPYVRLSNGTVISMRDLFPTPPEELGLASIPCTVVSIGDSEAEREAVFAVMSQWEKNHQATLKLLEKLKRYLEVHLFEKFISYLNAYTGQDYKRSEEQRRNDSTNENDENESQASLINVLMNYFAPQQQSPSNYSAVDSSATATTSAIQKLFPRRKLKVPSAAWSFKALKIYPCLSIQDLSRSHENLLAVLQFFLKIEHSIDATIECQSGNNLYTAAVSPYSIYQQHSGRFYSYDYLRKAALVNSIQTTIDQPLIDYSETLSTVSLERKMRLYTTNYDPALHHKQSKSAWC